ncbi:YdeI family protein [Paenibacillus sp. NPDC058177]|uniref:YdeI/OmpD-associated family protein n=1 Tax=Paenibacillus sp. NPDC058177 TaxID=3346369 RepID=UPI0036DEF8E1
MTTSSTNPKVDEFLGKAKKWKEEYEKLRNIVLDCGLTEEYKWMHPCYTHENKNIVLIHGFKDYCALLFHKGALLKDANGILIQQTENVQAARQIRFTNIQEIVELEAILKAYINEAIEVEKSGLEVELKKNTEYTIPEELQNKFDEIPGLKDAFEALTPGRQRAYILYFSDAKQAKTRTARVEKYMQHILDGKGLND